MEMALAFNDTTFTPVTRQNSLWIRAVELSQALGYKREDSVAKIYRANADEFTPDMAQVVEIIDNAESAFPVKSLLFSLRGCHLLAMFARTPVAKAFRVWVLDVLDKLAEEERATEPASNPDKLPAVSLSVTPSTVADRKPLRSLVNAWARVSGHPFDACWSQLKAAFSLTDIRDLPQEWIPDAVAWVQSKIDALPKAVPGATPNSLPPAPPHRPTPLPRPVLSAELERYASEFERLAHGVEDMEQLLVSVRRLSYPLTSEAARTLTGGRADSRGRLEAALEEHLDRSRRLAQELVPCARLGINIMRDLALGQGR